MDYTLLRPFDLEAAKRGAALIDPEDGTECLYVAGPHPTTQEIVVNFAGPSGFILGKASDFRMAPLCWVEGRPVYTGDVLYRLDTGAEGSATAAFGTGVVCSEWPERPFSADEVTWTPPKVKREGWVNVYPGLQGVIWATRDEADDRGCPGRLACIRIEWEESAK